MRELNKKYQSDKKLSYTQRWHQQQTYITTGIILRIIAHNYSNDAYTNKTVYAQHGRLPHNQVKAVSPEKLQFCGKQSTCKH